MNKDQQIAWQVSFKGAIELVANGIAVPDTDDIAAEIASLADALYEQASERLGISASSGKAQRPSRKPSRTSTKSSSGRSQGGGNYKYASEKQADLIVKLLDEKAHDIEYEESSFVWDGNDIEYDKVPSNITQDVIGFLLAQDDA